MAVSVFLATIAWTGVAQAQAGQIVPGLTAFDDNHPNLNLPNLGNPMGDPIVGSDCGQTMVFRFSMIDTTRSTLYFFQGSGCDDPMVRNSTTQRNCVQLDVTPIPTNNRSQVLEAEIPVDELVPCDAGGIGTQNIFVLALNNTNDTVSGAGQMATFPLAYRFVGPAAPSGFMATGGEAIHVSWELTTDPVVSYEAFIVPGCEGTSSGGDGSVPPMDGSVLDASVPDASMLDASVPDASTLDASTLDASTLDASTLIGEGGVLDGSVDSGVPPGVMPIEFGGSGTTSGTFDFPDSVPLNGQASVAVRAVDRFGNKGSLTSFVCVTRYPVTSWWDMHCSGTSPPPECSSDGCAIAPAGHKSALGFASVAIAALALIVRRRRSPR